MTALDSRIQKFTEKGTSYHDFLSLAAQPLLFSTDLLYSLWFNFKAHQQTKRSEQAPYWVVSDLILSGLCQPVGIDVFRMEEDIRNQLLPLVQPETQREIAQFVQEYAQRYKSQLSKNIYEIHSIWAKGILQPQEMEKQIIEKLQNSNNDHQKINYLSLYYNALPSQAQGKEATHITLEVAEDENDPQILKAILPLDLKRRVKGLENYQESQVEKSNQRIKEILEENLRTKNPILDLSKLGIEDIEQELAPIFDYTHIAKLYLQENKITYFPFLLLNRLSNLKELYLQGNPIENLPKEVFDGNCLEDVQNYFEAQKRIKKALNSKELELRGLKLKVLPDTLYELKQLRRLFLTNNRLTTINPKIKELRQLEVLGIEDNQLEYLPKELGNLFALRFLDVSGNKLTSLPESFLSLQLSSNETKKWDNKGLRLSRNNFAISDEWLENNEPLIIIERIIRDGKINQKIQAKNSILDLSNQGIVDLTTEVLEKYDITYVEILRLEDNQITHFPTDLLDKLPNLKELYLQGNPIENLPKEVFDFDGNCLESVKNYLAQSQQQTPQPLTQQTSQQQESQQQTQKFQQFTPEPETSKNFTQTINGVSFEMIWVEGGTFTIGSAKGNKSEQPPTQITLESFYMAKYPVTQELYGAVMGKNPSHFKGNPQNPVEMVSWNDAQTFIKKLKELLPSGGRGLFRLSSEAQWEYAAKGRQKSQDYEYAGSNDINEVAWYEENSNDKTQPVGLLKPNELGLYDMSGNVWEWCEDDWHNNYEGVPSDGAAWIDNHRASFRVLRGGSWSDYAAYCRVAFRDYDAPDRRNSSFGFRLVCSL